MKKFKNMYLKFLTPAKDFFDALPFGNGKVGGVCIGGVRNDGFNINDFRFFDDGFVSGDYPNLPNIKEEIIENLRKNNLDSAENLLTKKLSDANFVSFTGLGKSLCDVIFNFNIEKNVFNYTHFINLFSGEVVCDFDYSFGGQRREMFVDMESSIICVKISSKLKSLLNLQIYITPHQSSLFRSNVTAQNTNIKNEEKELCYSEKNFIVYKNKNFGVLLKVEGEVGQIEEIGGGLSIKNERVLRLYIKTFKDEDVENVKKSLKVNYEKLLISSKNIFCKKVLSTKLSFGKQYEKSINEELLTQKLDKITPSLLEKLFYFGRYLYVSNCIALMHFQSGVVGYTNSKETFNYLMKNRVFFNELKGVGEKREIKEALEEVYRKIESYKKNAEALFKNKGIFIPDIEEKSSGMVGSILCENLLNLCCGANITALINCYFESTGDIEFLKSKGYEIVLNVATFYKNFFKKNEVTKVYESPFSTSPYCKALNTGRTIASNVSCDFVCAKYVFLSLIKICEVLGKTEEKFMWEEALSFVPDVEVDDFGLIKEYNSGVFFCNNALPYIPHLFPYNIGLKPINPKNDYENLVSNTIRFRYSSSFGTFTCEELLDLSLALFTCGEGIDGYELLCVAIKNFLKDNLIFSSTDFMNMGAGRKESSLSLNSLDKNLEFTSCILNMFINCNKNNIYLFKNIPPFCKKGFIKNINLSGIICDVDFNLRRKIIKLKFVSKKSTFINLFLPKSYKDVKGKILKSAIKKEGVVESIPLKENKGVKIKVYYK